MWTRLSNRILPVTALDVPLLNGQTPPQVSGARLVVSSEFSVRFLVGALQSGLGKGNGVAFAITLTVSHNKRALRNVFHERYVEQPLRSQVSIQRVNMNIKTRGIQPKIFFVSSEPVGKAVGIIRAAETKKSVDLLPRHHRAKETIGNGID